MVGFRSSLNRANGVLPDAASVYGLGNDPYAAFVSTILQCEGSNGSTTFTDYTGQTSWSVGTGSPVISTTRARYGTSSLSLPGSSRITGASSALFGFDAGDYTLEGFVWVPGFPSVQTLFDTRTAGNTGTHFFIQGDSTLGASSNTAQIGSGSGGVVVVASRWQHVAMSKTSGALTGWIEGIQSFSITDARTFASASTCQIGGDYAGTGAQYITGYLDCLRITKGVGRYTAAFSPPAIPFR